MFAVQAQRLWAQDPELPADAPILLLWPRAQAGAGSPAWLQAESTLVIRVEQGRLGGDWLQPETPGRTQQGLSGFGDLLTGTRGSLAPEYLFLRRQAEEFPLTSEHRGTG